MQFHETNFGTRFFNAQLPALINVLQDIAGALNHPNPQKQEVLIMANIEVRPPQCNGRACFCILRIYQYKDSNTRLFHLLASFKSTIRRPYGGDYALRYEGTIPLNPVDFHEMIHTRPLEQILEIPVENPL